MSERTSLGPGEGPGEWRPGAGYTGETRAEEPVDPRIWGRIHDYQRRHPGGPERLIPLLHLAQESLGYLPFAVQEHIAARLGLPLVQVHGVVTFYNYFNTRPRGRYQLKVCRGTACFVRRARELTDAIRQVLGVEIGGVTMDGLFGLEEVHCVGSCGVAPVMLLGEETHGNLTPGEARKLVLALQSRARREKGAREGERPDD